MSVVDDRLSFISVPTVQLHAAAAVIQSSGRRVIVQRQHETTGAVQRRVKMRFESLLAVYCAVNKKKY